MSKLFGRFSTWDSSGFMAIVAGAIMAIILILLVTILPAKADENNDSEMTRMTGVSLVCGDKGGAFFINAKSERVWQSDLGEKEGLENEVLEFKRFRCPNTYEIKSRITFMGESLDYVIRTRGCATKNVKMTVTQTVHGEKETFSYTCLK